MTVEYSYADTYFLNDVCNEDSFTAEIVANETITTDLDYVRTSEDEDTGSITVYVGFASTLSSGEEAALDALAAAHTGAAPMVVTWHASSVLTDAEKSITDTDPDWTELGGAVTTPDFFTSNVAACKGRVVGMVKSNGTGAKLRLKEDSTTPSGGFDVPDTSGAWQAMQWFSPDAPTSGTHAYMLEGQLPSSGATAVSVKFVAVSLLEFG
jgi:hypothetical protein